MKTMDSIVLGLLGPSEPTVLPTKLNTENVSVKSIFNILKLSNFNVEIIDNQALVIKNIHDLNIIVIVNEKRIILLSNLNTRPNATTLDKAKFLCNELNAELQMVRCVASLNDDNTVAISVMYDIVFHKELYTSEFIYQVALFAQNARIATNQLAIHM